MSENGTVAIETPPNFSTWLDENVSILKVTWNLRLFSQDQEL
jgi:hypothetical protein